MKNICLYIIVSLTLLSGCLKDEENEWDIEKEKEKERIAKFLKEHNITTKPTGSGLYYIETVEGDSLSPKFGDFVLYDYTVWKLDSTFLVTTDSLVAIKYDKYKEDRFYVKERRQIGSSFFTPAENEALSYMKENGECTVIAPFELAAYHLPWSSIYTTLIFDFKLHKVIKDPIAYEKQLIDTFLLNNPDYTEIIDGLYYKKLVEGNGISISESDNLKYTFTLYLMDGKVVIEDTYDLNFWNIPVYGLVKGIPVMTEQEQGIFMIRSDLAYGKKDYVDVPPYSTVFFNIKIDDVY